MQSKNSILNKKKIIVTGAAGFVGKSVVKKLINKNFFVISVDTKDPKIKHKNHRFFKSSVKNFFLKKTTTNAYAIVHLAADPRNNYYFQRPELALENISNMFYILNFIKSLSTKPILIFSSTKQIELDILAKNIGPYSLSKKFGEEIINFYFKNYGIKSYIIRFTEVFSMKGNPKNKALGKFIDKCSNNEDISIDNPNHKFEFISTDVISDGIIKILNNKVKTRVINFYGNKLNILDLLKKIKQILKSVSKIKVKKISKKKIIVTTNKQINYKIKKKDLFITKLDKLIKNELS
tara:strand:+ start:534 stop:1412 length:879 start_codon:yes stop_codon:yes gene_type:complete